jgi:hypothetical protein
MEDDSDERLHVPALPCPTCPYRRDPEIRGVWHFTEYLKLVGFDPQPDGPGRLSTFHCHQETRTGRPMACRGWLTVHRDSPAVRLAVIEGRVTMDDLDAPVDVDLYASGKEAALAGLSGHADPPQHLIDKLLAQGIGHLDEATPSRRRVPADPASELPER